MTDSEKDDQILREKLTSRALKANEDIKAGRVYTTDEAKDYLAKRRESWK